MLVGSLNYSDLLVKQALAFVIRHDPNDAFTLLGLTVPSSFSSF